MFIQFNFQGTPQRAGLVRHKDRLVVRLNNEILQKQFGPALPFYIKNASVEFDTLNRCHSDLFALNTTISKAIKEQCRELLQNCS